MAIDRKFLTKSLVLLGSILALNAVLVRAIMKIAALAAL